MRLTRTCFLPALLLSWLLCAAVFAAGAGTQRVIIRTDGPGDRVAAVVRSMGGRVVHRYSNVDAIAAEIPLARRRDLLELDGIRSVRKDRLVRMPRPTATQRIGARPMQAPRALQDRARELARPSDFSFNNALTGASQFFYDEDGSTRNVGQGVVVAVIDTGIANHPTRVQALAGKVLGGENLIPGDPLSATSTQNDPHGTQVATMIAADTLFLLDASEPLVQALDRYAPGNTIACEDSDFPPDTCPAGVKLLPMIGTAPGAKIYALKVFSTAEADGAPISRVIEAMDRVITLRKNCDEGVPVAPVNPECLDEANDHENNPCRYEALPISVVNLSLGHATLFPDGSEEYLLVEQMLEAGITVVASAGNEGPAPMTGGSPGTAPGALTVGAASVAFQERILWDIQFGPGAGLLARPSDGVQTAFFSARGPTADGRIDPEIVTGGYANFVQGSDGGLDLISGTSFAAPAVSGLVALLRNEFPEATAVELRNALVESANPAVLADGSGEIDQGRGFVDAVAAYGLLRDGQVGKELPDTLRAPSRRVRTNLARAGYPTVRLTRRRQDEPPSFRTRAHRLLPGQASHFFVEVSSRTASLRVSVGNIDRHLPEGEQNQFFGVGDELWVKVQDAPISTEATLVDEFLTEDARFDIDRPQPGILRISLLGAWTNAGEVSADIAIEEFRATPPSPSVRGRIGQSELKQIPIFVPGGTTEAVFDLSWLQNWRRNPTDDLDMFIYDPRGKELTGGATASLDSAERWIVENPMPGTYRIDIEGFAVHGLSNPTSRWALHVSDQNGRLLRGRPVRRPSLPWWRRIFR